jgi:hypothetical protein
MCLTVVTVAKIIATQTTSQRGKNETRVHCALQIIAPKADHGSDLKDGRPGALPGMTSAGPGRAGHRDGAQCPARSELGNRRAASLEITADYPLSRHKGLDGVCINCLSALSHNSAPVADSLLEGVQTSGFFCLPSEETKISRIHLLADRPPLLFGSGQVTSSPPVPFRSTEGRLHSLGLVAVDRCSLFAAVFR